MKTLKSNILTAFLFLTIISCFTGCKKDEAKTTYQIINNTTKISSGYQYLDGTLWEVIVYCYIGTDIARQDNIASVASGGGKSDIIAVESKHEKVKISMKLLPAASPYYTISANQRQYVVSYTVLEKGKNNIITISDNTQVSATLTSSGIKTNLGIAFENFKENILK